MHYRLREQGFTLLEILVAVAILGIAITVIIQLFSTNIKALAVSSDYVTAIVYAEAKMREILDDDKLSEKAWSEKTPEGYRFDIAVSEIEKERTDGLQVRLFEIRLAVHWLHGNKERVHTLTTMKVVPKQV
jgi:prepilin-type N-terminal cleavage/methylation domain-containing protein